MSIGSPSCWSVVVAAATDVAVPDGLGVGGGVGQEGLVEPGLEDRSDRPIARCANADPTATCGFEALRPIGLLHPQMPRQDRKPCSGWGFVRMIVSHSATVDGPTFSAAASRRAGVQKAYRRCDLLYAAATEICGSLVHARLACARGSW